MLVGESLDVYKLWINSDVLRSDLMQFPVAHASDGLIDIVAKELVSTISTSLTCRLTGSADNERRSPKKHGWCRQRGDLLESYSTFSALSDINHITHDIMNSNTTSKRMPIELLHGLHVGFFPLMASLIPYRPSPSSATVRSVRSSVHMDATLSTSTCRGPVRQSRRRKRSGSEGRS